MSQINSSEEMAAVEDVSEMELTELERIRESLRMQLCDEDESTSDSESSCIEKVQFEIPSESADISLDVSEELGPSSATSKGQSLYLETSLESKNEPSNPENVSLSTLQSGSHQTLSSDRDQTLQSEEGLFLRTSLESQNESSNPENVSLSTLQSGSCPGENLFLRTSLESKNESSNPENVSLSASQLDRCLGESLLLETSLESTHRSLNPENVSPTTSQSDSCPGESLFLRTSIESQKESSNPENVSLSTLQSGSCPGENLFLRTSLESKNESSNPENVSLSASQLDRCLGESLLLETSLESTHRSLNPENVSPNTSQSESCPGNSLFLQTSLESELESSNPESILQSEQTTTNPKSPIIDDHLLPYSKADSIKISESEENRELSSESAILLDGENTNFTVADNKVSIDCANTKPPLVMHSSNLLLNEGLDNSHGGGGFETTGQAGSPPGKRRRVEFSAVADSEMVLVNEDSQQAADSEMVQVGEDSQQGAGCEDSTMDNEMEDYENGNVLDDMEFDILDEYESDGKEEEEETPNNEARSTSGSSSDEEMDHDQIEALLDEKLKNSKTLDPKDPLAHQEKQKVVLKVKGRDHFEVLPEGWVEVTHNCGMPVYLHKQTRVCSMSKPYFLGPGSTRKHKIPLSAIPCLHYQKETEREKQRAEALQNALNGLEDASSTPAVPTGCPVDPASKENGVRAAAANGLFPSASLQSARELKEAGSIDFLALRRYCEKRFEFQRITVKRFSTWTGRRNHQRKMKLEQRPFLADNTQLISCRPVLLSDNSTAAGPNNSKKEFIMNPSGKSPVCILHEYVQHALRMQPSYEFRELENAATPYGAAVVIDGIRYGNGFGSSKKLAKSAAAEAALRILIPNMKLQSKEESSQAQDQDVEFFDQVRVEDPRVSDLSVKAGQPFPYQILLECLKRNYGMGDTAVELSMKNLKHQKNEFHMKVGNHEVSVVCKNKRDGKHRASQAILQKLHPHISSWGSLLRMYGKGSFKTLKEKKEEEQRITELQSKACANKPNTSILGKLKEEMLKYREKVISKKPIGKLIPERMEILPTSSSNLKNLEL